MDLHRAWIHLNDHRENNHTLLRVATSLLFFLFLDFVDLLPRRIRKVRNVKLQVLFGHGNREISHSFDADWKNSSEKSRCFRIISSEIVLVETWGWVRQFDFGNNRTRSVRELESWKRREISRSIPSEFCRLVPKFLTRKMILSTEIKCGFLCPNIVKRNSSYPYFVRFLLFFYLYYRVILNETRKMRLKIWNWFFF